MTRKRGNDSLLGGLLFFFLWPLYLPYLIVKWVLSVVYGAVLAPVFRTLGLGDPFVGLSARTLGWVKMKLGLWQQIGFSPAHSGGGYDYTPQWVRKTARKKHSGKLQAESTYYLTGRSFTYRVEYDLRGQKTWDVRYYRKLRTPLRIRALDKLKVWE